MTVSTRTLSDTVRRIAGCFTPRCRRSVRNRTPLWSILFAIALSFMVQGCSALNAGRWLGIVRTATDEKYYLLKEVFLTSGSAYTQKDAFDHTMNEVVNLFFTPRQEKNNYVAESIWTDPSGIEFRTIRTTYDVQVEQKKESGMSPRTGKQRVHTMSTREMFNHKPGLWKVALYIDGEMARRLTFSIQ
jgi:hypothetical protein